LRLTLFRGIITMEKIGPFKKLDRCCSPRAFGPFLSPFTLQAKGLSPKRFGEKISLSKKPECVNLF
jgi:hypothetical protein